MVYKTPHQSYYFRIMAETNSKNDLIICKSELIACRGAIAVAVGIIVLENGFGSPPVEDLTDLPSTAGIVLVVSRGRSVYTLPGGKTDAKDPSHLNACRREIREELGIIAETPRFYMRRIEPAVSDPSTMVDVSAYHIPGFKGEIQPQNEIDTLIVLPISRTEQSVPIGGVALDVLNRLQPAA